MGAIILDGAEIGSSFILGARMPWSLSGQNSLGCWVLGSPAKFEARAHARGTKHRALGWSYVETSKHFVNSIPNDAGSAGCQLAVGGSLRRHDQIHRMQTRKCPASTEHRRQCSRAPASLVQRCSNSRARSRSNSRGRGIEPHSS